MGRSQEPGLLGVGWGVEPGMGGGVGESGAQNGGSLCGSLEPGMGDAWSLEWGEPVWEPGGGAGGRRSQEGGDKEWREPGAREGGRRCQSQDVAPGGLNGVSKVLRLVRDFR